MKQKIILPLLISSLTTIILIFGSFFFVEEFLSIHKFMLLKWLPLLICIIAFSIAGFVTKNVPNRFLPLLFLPLILFKPYQHLHFPFALFLLLTSVLTLLLFRRSIKNTLKTGMLFSLIGIMSYHLFSQPLIIEQENFGYNSQGELINAITLWDFSSENSKKLPDHVLTKSSGEQFNLKELQGKTVYLSFWATWCGPCLKQKPALEALKEKYKGDSTVLFVDISLDQESEKWATYLAKHEPLGIQVISKEADDTRKLLGIGGLPTRIIADAHGNYKECNPLVLAEKLLGNRENVINYVSTKWGDN